MSDEGGLDPAVLRDEVSRARADLVDTVAALAAKTDVKTRARDAVADVADHARSTARDLVAETTEAVDRVNPAVALAVTVAAVVVFLVWLARRRRG